MSILNNDLVNENLEVLVLGGKEEQMGGRE